MSEDGTALLLIDLQEAFFENPAMAASRGAVLAAVRRLVDHRGAMRAREVLEILARAELAPRDRAPAHMTLK